LIPEVNGNINSYKGCYECSEGGSLGYCSNCYERGFRCLDQKHTLVPDQSLIGSTCQRATNPSVPLECDRRDCRKNLQGLYLRESFDTSTEFLAKSIDCCRCDEDDFDICLECVLLKGRGCRDSTHRLNWGVLPIELPAAITEALEKTTDALASGAQEVINLNGPEYWDEEAAERCWQSAIHFGQLWKQLMAVEEGTQNGQVKIELAGKYFSLILLCHHGLPELTHLPFHRFPDTRLLRFLS
jgi:hypothetical protein